MANYHLQFDDEDVKNGLLNVDPDGCLKGVTPERVLFTEKRNGVTYCCGIPAAEMTIQEALDLCRANLGNLFYTPTGGLSLVLSVMISPIEDGLYAMCGSWRISDTTHKITTVELCFYHISSNQFKQEE